MTENKNTIVVGLGFGDEGKGTVTQHIATAQNVNAVVKFSGGAQTAHNVVLKNGLEHTFAQFGSGTLNGIQTLITEYTMVNPFSMAAEANVLWNKTGVDPFVKTFISENSLLTTPIHVAANRKRETLRGKNAHGSCAAGIGETMGYAINHPVLALRVGDLRIPGFLETKLNELLRILEAELGKLDVVSIPDIIGGYEMVMDDRPFNIVSNDYIYNELRKGNNVFEGSQGILLDESKGFHPHTTWTSVVSRNAQRVLEAAKLPRGKVVGVTRSYATRHGYGPFPSEYTDEDWRISFPEKHNVRGTWQGSWRGGILDLVLLNYAVRANGGIDEVALTHLDVPYEEVIDSYDDDTIIIPVSEEEDLVYQESITNRLLGKLKVNTTRVRNEEELIEYVEFATNAPVSIKSYGPMDTDKVNSLLELPFAPGGRAWDFVTEDLKLLKIDAKEPSQL